MTEETENRLIYLPAMKQIVLFVLMTFIVKNILPSLRINVLLCDIRCTHVQGCAEGFNSFGLHVTHVIPIFPQAISDKVGINLCFAD